MNSLYYGFDQDKGRWQRNWLFTLFVGFLVLLAYPAAGLCGNFDLVKTIDDGHAEIVTAVACSPDGSTIATGGVAGAVSLWDFNSGKLLQTLGDDLREVRAVAFSPDGDYLAAAVITGNRKHNVQVWDLETGRLLHDMKGHTQQINGIAFAPDSKRIVSVSNDNTVRIWNMRYGELESSEKQTKNNIISVAYSADGKQIIATENWGGAIQIWDAVNVRLERSFQGHDDWVLATACSPNGNNFVTGSRDGSVSIWNSATGEVVKKLREPELDPVNSVVYSPNGRFVVAGTQSRNLLIWRVADGRLFDFYEGHQQAVTDVSFEQKGRYLVSSSLDGTVRIWNGPGQEGAEALYHLAQKHDLGVGPLDKNSKFAAELYGKAAQAGHAEAQYRLGVMLRQGDGVDRNEQEAVKWLEMAAKQGHKGAMAQSTPKKEIVQPPVAQAKPETVLPVVTAEVKKEAVAAPKPVVATKKAVEPVVVPPVISAEMKKETVAKPTVAIQKAVEPVAAPPVKIVVPQAKKEVVAKSKPVAAAPVVSPKPAPAVVVEKDKEALYQEGLAYLKGSGVAKDNSKAFSLFEKAATLGHADAQYRLGFMYSLGRGVKKDDRQAIKWWERAAKQNNGEAQYFLGYMYEIGAGVKQDLGVAKKWYKSAAANGNVNAVQSLRMMP
ncbi:MAG: hypothetical protein OEY01_08575 [Desulfobulbaceae bacterium]|nr:hypothetical protein [Desulfobulbaceae bacterium]HIJ79058.1 hypothetical protein [Deltaproteobacteria bacterium]